MNSNFKNDKLKERNDEKEPNTRILSKSVVVAGDGRVRIGRDCAGGSGFAGRQWELSYWPQPEKAVTDPAALSGIEVKTIPAKVPGNVELDLLAAGLIDDPMIGANVNKLRAWEGYQWCYTRRFDAPKLEPGQRAELWFGGIDCLADVWVNGKHAGSSADMLIERSFDVTDLIEQGGSNTVQVIIRRLCSARRITCSARSAWVISRPKNRSISCKAPHMYGWDIAPVR